MSPRPFIIRAVTGALILCASSAHAGVRPPRTATTDAARAAQQPAALTAAEVEADLALFEAAFVELHPSFAGGRRGEALQRFMAGVRAAATVPLTSVELYRLLAPAAAIAQDGHTALTVPGDVSAPWKLLPVRVRVEPAAGAIWAIESVRPGIPAGSRIDAINGIPASTLIAAIASTVPRDGESTGRIAWTLSRGFRFGRALAAMFGPSDTYRLDIAPPGGGAARAVTVEGATFESLSAGLPPTEAEVSLRFEREGRIAVLRIPNFGASAGEQITRAFAALRERPTSSLVIDLRDNPGGRDDLGKDLFAHLAAEPFGYYRSLRVLAEPRHPAFEMVAAKRQQLPQDADGSRRVPSPNLGPQQPVPSPFAGRVLVLVNAGTFSTAAEFTSVARAASRVAVVGEETGGGRCGNNSGVVVPVVLPHSKLRLDVPLVEYTLAVPCDGDRHGVRPDHLIINTLEDELHGRDPQLEAALDLAARTGERR